MPENVEPQPVAPVGTFIAVKLPFPEKMFDPSVGLLPANSTDVKLLLEKAEAPILVTEAGIVTDVSRDVNPLYAKAEAPIPTTGCPSTVAGITKSFGQAY
jgi:hypothetical protein